MSKGLRIALVSGWLIIFPFAFAIVFIRTPALWFINLPEPAWRFLDELFNVTCCEEMADLEFLVAIFFGLIIALILLVMFFWCRRIWRHSKS